MAELECGPVGPFTNRDMALRVAVSEALRIYRIGRPARVVVYDRNCRLRAEHCVCGNFAANGQTGQAYTGASAAAFPAGSARLTCPGSPLGQPANISLL